MKNIVVFSLMVFVFGCVGTDFEDDPKDASILTNTEVAQLMIGNTITIEAQYYYNMWVVVENEQLIWDSMDESIATVNQVGVISGVSKGQTTITVSSVDEISKDISITVVEDASQVASVVVTAPETSILVGETLQFSAEALTIDNTAKGDAVFTWITLDTNIATISEDGLLAGIADGSVGVVATSEGVSSQPFTIMVGNDARIGQFMGSGSYDAKGTAIMTFNGSDELILTFSDDFSTDFALGTFVYLANVTGGTAVRSQGLEISEVSGNGAQQYNISNVDASVGFDTYKFVVLLCKPASITFGTAELK